MSKQKLLGRDKVAAAVVGIYSTVETTGNLVDALCKTVHSVYKGAPIPKDDITYVCEEVARARKWSPASARVRANEVTSVLKAYEKLPAIVEAAKKKVDSFTWHNAVALARAINRGASATKAVAAFVSNRKAKKVDPATIPAKDAKGKAASSVKSMLKMTKLPAAFRAALRTLCEEHHIAV